MDGEQGAAEVVAVLPVVPWTLASLAAVLVVALAVPPGPRPEDLRSAPSPVVRLPVALLAAALAVAALLGARSGPDDALRNPVPALVVGLGLPLLLLLPPLLGPLARRVVPRPPPGDQDARPAVLGAAGLVAALVLPADPTRPSTVATTLGAYVLVVAAAAIAFGRARTAAQVEVLGLLARWAALGPRLVRWAPPRGATAVLAVVLGGAWFERWERTAAWREDLPGRAEVVVGLAVALLVAGVLALLLVRAVGGSAAACLLPLALATLVAGVARRALISAQLLADRAGAGSGTVDPDPLGVAGGQLLALVLIALGGALSCAVLARRRGEGADRLPGVGVLLVMSAVSAAVVLAP